MSIRIPGPTIRLTYRSALIFLVFLAAALRFANIPTVNVRTPDERVYTWRSGLWLEQGAEGMHREIQDFQTTRQYPPPTRIGLFEYMSWIMRLTGRRDVIAGALSSAAASTCAFILLALICYRFLSPVPALIALLLYAVAPLDLDLARRAWLEGPTEAIALAMVYLTCRIVANPAERRTPLRAGLLALAGSVAFTLKESMPLPFLLSAIPALWALLRARQVRTVAIFAGSGLLSGAAVLAWMSWAIGGFQKMIQIQAGTMADMKVQPYTMTCCIGPPHLLFQAFTLLTPVVALAIVAGLASLFLWSPQPNRETVLMRWICLIAGGQVAFIMLTYMDLRYLAPALGLLYLIAGYGAARVFRLLTERLRASSGLRPLASSVALACLLAIALLDYARFQRLFVRDDLQDPTVRAIIDNAR